MKTFVFNMDKKALEPVYTLCSGIPSVYSLLFWNHLDQDILLCGTKTGAVYTWDLNNARITNKPQFEIGMSPCVSLSNSDDILVTQDKLGSVKLWQETPCSWTEIKSFHLDHTGFCRVDVSNLKDNLAAIPRHKGGLEIYNLKSYEKVTSFNDSDTDIYEQLGELMACKLITISGVTYVIAAYENEELCLWDFRKEGVVSKHKLPGCPTSLEFDNELGKGICGTSSSKIPIFCVDKAGTFSTCPTVKLKCRGSTAFTYYVVVHFVLDLIVLSFPWWYWMSASANILLHQLTKEGPSLHLLWALVAKRRKPSTAVSHTRKNQHRQEKSTIVFQREPTESRAKYHSIPKRSNTEQSKIPLHPRDNQHRAEQNNIIACSVLSRKHCWKMSVMARLLVSLDRFLLDSLLAQEVSQLESSPVT
uniref:Uncharacterized protein n=1 Tax=Timema tahoe TaxID=61484 RepID=A0A7R9FMB7_9NEOP|nr:unnamed protein product [Timema tahoe]